MVGTTVPAATALFGFLMVANVLGPQGRGFVAAATAPFLFITSAFTLGLPEAITYFGARGELRSGKLTRQPILLLGLAGLGGVGATWAVSGTLADGDGSLQMAMILCSIAGVPSLVLLGVRSLAISSHRWRLVAVERVSGALVRLFALCMFATFGVLTAWNGSLIVAISATVGGLAYVRFLRNTSVIQYSSGTSVARLSSILRYGQRSWLGSLAGILLMRLDQLLLTPLSSLEDLGLYVVAVNVAEVALLFNTAVREVVFSKQAGLSDDNSLARACRASNLITFGVSASLAAVVPLALPLVFGNDFRASVSSCLVLLLAISLGNPGSIVGAGLSAIGHPGLRSWSLLLAVVLNTALLVVLVPRFGALGAAFATLGGNLVSAGMNIVFYCRLREVSPAIFLLPERADLKLLTSAARSVLSRRVSSRDS